MTDILRMVATIATVLFAAQVGWTELKGRR
jgi:hypothetical protein